MPQDSQKNHPKITVTLSESCDVLISTKCCHCPTAIGIGLAPWSTPALKLVQSNTHFLRGFLHSLFKRLYLTKHLGFYACTACGQDSSVDVVIICGNVNDRRSHDHPDKFIFRLLRGEH